MYGKGIVLQNILNNEVNFKPINCKLHNSGKIVCQFIVRCCIHFWCRKINKIVRGRDSKLINFIKRHQNTPSIDPIKVIAHKKMLNSSRRLK